MTWTPYTHNTDAELIRDHRASDEPLVAELAKRLDEAVHQAKEHEKDIEDAEHAIEEVIGKRCFLSEGIKALIDKVNEVEDAVELAQQPLLEEIDDLKEQVAFEDKRVNMFANESRRFQKQLKEEQKRTQDLEADNKRLKAQLLDVTMLRLSA